VKDIEKYYQTSDHVSKLYQGEWKVENDEDMKM